MSVHPSQRTADDVAAQFEVDPEVGLTTEQADRIREEYGPNELRQKPPVPLWRKILAQFQDPLVYLLFVAMAISIVVWVFEGATGLPIDAIVIALIVIANAIIGLVQENKAEGAVAALAQMTASSTTVLRDGEITSIESTQLVPGDILVLSEGDAVGADARLISATGLRVQEASLTGESEATDKNPEAIPAGAPLGDRHNMVHKGTGVVQGVGRAIITATGMDTEVGAIADMLDSTEADKSPLTREIEKVSKLLGVLVIAIAVIVMAVMFLLNDVNDVSEAVEILLLGVSLAVAAVPEGLPAILSLVLAIGVRAMARRNAIMKELHSVETLGASSVIASDKTGTLTRNEMTVRTIVTASGQIELTGTGYEPVGEVVGEPSAEALAEARLVVTTGALANNAQLREDDGWQIEGDPTEAAFLVALPKLHEAELAFSREAEVPFTSERKMMSVAGTGEGGRSLLLTKGAPDVLLSHCTTERIGEETVDLTGERRRDILATIERLSAEGYRTLGAGYRVLDAIPDDVDDALEDGLTFTGMVGIMDPPREEAKIAIAEAKAAGIRPIMITGDHPRTAARIGADLGIVEAGSRALTGVDLDKLGPSEFRDAVRDVSIYARVSPEHKLRIINELQDDGRIVAMTGDGVNDAPALKTADIGVAMGITGTEVTKEASQMVLADDNYATIVAAVRHGRTIFDNIRKFLRFLLSSNMGEVMTVFFGVVLAGFLGLSETAGAGLAVPLLATQILWINLVTDSGPALAMGVDPEDGDVMRRPPRDPKRPIIDRHMWSRIGFIGIVMATVSLLAIDLFLPGGLFTLEPDTLTGARTVGFTTLVFAQLFNALNSRSDYGSAFRGFFSNHWLWGSIALAVVLQIAVVHLPFMQVAFSTEAMTTSQWLTAVGLASVVLWAEEIAKLFRRALARER
ncbi:haloacid dehalogenase [Bowdeniella nasicola]|uniref:Haloacid dehalogenase n=1 Tax=Bowdeniella nasicola TaxID=208480 RepID=A0A1Q5Q0K1_9ACTO|nr:haloacid dehalogenase [Bowdeniella nasicola]